MQEYEEKSQYLSVNNIKILGELHNNHSITI